MSTTNSGSQALGAVRVAERRMGKSEGTRCYVSDP